MKTDQFNKENPFKVPEGYFDTLQERIMARVGEEHPPVKTIRLFGTGLYRKLVAAAACLVFIFTTVTVYRAFTNRQPVIAEANTEDDAFYQWFYASDKAAWLAETLNPDVSGYFAVNEENTAEEDDAIIHFLERSNINVAAIAYSMDNTASDNIP